MSQWDQCQPLKNTDGGKGWCYTRSFHNNSAIIGEWGYCDLRCKSQDQIEDPHFNLASKKHNEMWNEDIFMLDTGSKGHCHTYNPSNKSFARNKGTFYAMLGRYSI